MVKPLNTHGPASPLHHSFCSTASNVVRSGSNVLVSTHDVAMDSTFATLIRSLVYVR